MSKLVALLLVGLLSGPAPDEARLVPEGAAPGSSTVASPPGVLTTSAAREARRLVRSIPPELRKVQPTPPQPKNKGWIARHPKLFGALVGLGVGCIAGASHVGGSEDNFFNALDELACPVVGGIGAGAGAGVGSLVK